MELARETMISPEPELSPESKKQRKLQKDMSKAGPPSSGGAFRKLFGRKNRQSKVPDNAAERLNSMVSANERAAAPSPAPVAPLVPQPVVAERPTAQREETEYMTPREERSDPVSPQSPPAVPIAPVEPQLLTPVLEPTYEPPSHDQSRINTADAVEAKDEFARFDQGPLLDQPAFLSDEVDEVDDAVPPPIARHSSRSPLPSPQTDEAPSPPPVARAVDPQDRWAQIRKNAAERAAQRAGGGPSEDKAVGGLVKPIEVDDDTSGEETIESRVARIKARVAELTSNAEGISGPGNRSAPARR